MTTAVVLMGLMILALLAVSAVFSAAETALTRASRGRMHQLEREHDPAARRVNLLLAKEERMIGAVLIGYNALNILASSLATELITHAIPGAEGVAIATGIMTVLVVVFVEVMPKTLAIVRADDVARAISSPMLLATRVLGPVIAAVQWVVRLTFGLFGVKLERGMDVLAAREEIRGAVALHHSEGAFEARERQMLGGVLDLYDLDVSEIMVHRKSITMLDGDLPPRELVARIMDAEHTRLPVYRTEPENIIGVVHAKDLLKGLVQAGGVAEKVDVAAIMRPPWFIPETTSLKDQLAAFLKRRTHFALVVDEYGALQGLVTLEDILEEIVGEIQDEYDEPVQGVRRQPDGSVLVDGDVTIRDLNRAMDWTLPDEHAVTVAGLVIHEARAIPEPGQRFLFHDHRFQVLRRQRNQVTLLRVSPPLPENEAL
ncbi:MAG TPA: HlyC/CorC family transporter [Caulobacteraceae bacterium]|nr:HlyC/CorC family transporter [Caulobacteraceae bacterium]